MMKLLIDGDLPAYEAASAADMVDEGHERRSIDWTFEYVDNLIEFICKECGVEPPTYIFLTGKDNFRYDVATVKPYKGNRKDQEKPFYLPSVRKYLETKWGAVVVDGMEADDALCITAGDYKPEEVIIASRDKDLRQFPCVHYSWECGKQPSFGPELIDQLGYLKPTFSKRLLKNGEPSKSIDKLSGGGMKWFYAQCITGDAVDNIPGLEGKGASYAYNILNEQETEEDCKEAVLEAYKQKYGEDYKTRFTEQATLLWMCRKMKKGKPVRYSFDD